MAKNNYKQVCFNALKVYVKVQKYQKFNYEIGEDTWTSYKTKVLFKNGKTVDMK